MQVITRIFLRAACRPLYQPLHHHYSQSYPTLEEATSALQGVGEGRVILDKGLDGIATIRLENPLKKNALSGRMMVELSKCVTELENWPSGVGVIMYGTGDNFCSGADKATIQANPTARGGLIISTLMHDTLARYVRLPIVTCTVIHGKAVGGGAELTTWSDFRLITSDASVHFVQARMGLTPGWGGGTRLRQLVGPTRALNIFLSASRLTVTDTLEMGLTQKVLTANRFVEEAELWVASRTFAKRDVVSAMKAIIFQEITDSKLREELANERNAFAEMFNISDVSKSLGKNIKFK